jgi:hypothetical protein
VRHLHRESLYSRMTDYTVPATEIDLGEARKTFETNFFAVISMCQAFLPLLMKAKGTIVMIGSVAGVSQSTSLICHFSGPDSLPLCQDHTLCVRVGLQRLKSRAAFVQRHAAGGTCSLRVCECVSPYYAFSLMLNTFQSKCHNCHHWGCAIPHCSY